LTRALSLLSEAVAYGAFRAEAVGFQRSDEITEVVVGPMLW
jgi:hypothetical protein